MQLFEMFKVSRMVYLSSLCSRCESIAPNVIMSHVLHECHKRIDESKILAEKNVLNVENNNRENGSYDMYGRPHFIAYTLRVISRS